MKRAYIVSDIMLHVQQDAKKQNNKVIGKYGEEIAAQFLTNKGFTIQNRNYLKKWGEIDIVARRTGKIHFVEVKTVSYETKEFLKESVSRDNWRPEDNIHAFKIKKLSKAIESWISQYKYEGEWQIDVIAVKVVPREKFATVKYLPNIIL
jgi:putative endonuclease